MVRLYLVKVLILHVRPLKKVVVFVLIFPRLSSHLFIITKIKIHRCTPDVWFFAEKSWYAAVFTFVTDGLAFRVSSGKKSKFLDIVYQNTKTSARWNYFVFYVIFVKSHRYLYRNQSASSCVILCDYVIVWDGIRRYLIHFWTILGHFPVCRKQ